MLSFRVVCTVWNPRTFDPKGLNVGFRSHQAGMYFVSVEGLVISPDRGRHGKLVFDRM